MAFIGSVGVPNTYGGFEAFLEVCAPEFANRGWDVGVTCDRSKYIDRSRQWGKVNRVFLPVPANGGLSPIHDIVAFLAIMFSYKNIVVLGVSAGLLFPVLRCICEISGKRLILNVDGVEHRRGKFNSLKRGFLWLSSYLAILSSNRVVVDNAALLSFLPKRSLPKATVIPYPGDHVKRVKKNLPTERLYVLSICRIEPENNVHMALRAFSAQPLGHYIFVGNWNASKYARKLMQDYAACDRVSLLDPIYDAQQIAELRENCSGYIHGHSVGGTNPSLVEMLFYDAPIAAFDCTFNRETAGDGCQYFLTEEDLSFWITGTLIQRNTNRQDLGKRRLYTVSNVVGAYESLFTPRT